MFRKIESQIQKTIDYYKRHGFLQFLKRFFGRLGFEHFSHDLIFIILDLKDFPEDVKKPYRFHLATIDDMKNENDYQDYSEYYGFTKREIIDRLQKGNRLFVLKENNKMLYFVWTEQKNAAIGAFRLPLHIPQDMLYLGSEFTSPEHRGKGIASKLKKEIFHYLKNEGVKKLLAVISPDNTTNLRMDKKLGFQEYQTINYKRYWHIRYYTVQKYNSDECKTFITLFKAPNDIWKTFL